MSRSLDIWGLLENPDGHCHLSDNLFYDEEAMGYARQGKFFCLGSQRAKNFSHAGRIARNDWKQRGYFGEIEYGVCA